MSLSNEYMVSFKCKKGEKLHAFLHRLAPFLKLVAFALVFPAIFYPMLSIAPVGLFIVSVAINYVKWYLLFNYNYTINDGVLTIKKIYRYIKSKTILVANLTTIERCEVVEELEVRDIPDRVECFCPQSTFKVFIGIKIKDNPKNYILVADNYFYSLLKENKENNDIF